MMVERYILLKDFLDVNDPDLIPLLLSPSDNTTVMSLFKDLEKFESVSKELQKEDISYLKIRLLFDSLVEEYPTLDNFFGPKRSNCSLNSLREIAFQIHAKPKTGRKRNCNFWKLLSKKFHWRTWNTDWKFFCWRSSRKKVEENSSRPFRKPQLDCADL